MPFSNKMFVNATIVAVWPAGIVSNLKNVSDRLNGFFTTKT
jgi:hypothetical protein